MLGFYSLEALTALFISHGAGLYGGYREHIGDIFVQSGEARSIRLFYD